MIYNRHGKRLFDLALIATSALTFLLLLPLFPLLLIPLRFLNGEGPILFSQVRAGLRGNPFVIYKFRTLVLNDVDKLSMDHVRPDHPLVTPGGRFLRRFKIDELPQLWNVIKGDMSIVGPRPVFLEMVEEYTPEQRRRLDVPPGLTGWSQIHGNCELTWDERIRLDLWYVDHVSFWLDLKILLMTVGVVFNGEIIQRRALDEADAYLATRRLQPTNRAPITDRLTDHRRKSHVHQ